MAPTITLPIILAGPFQSSAASGKWSVSASLLAKGTNRWIEIKAKAPDSHK